MSRLQDQAKPHLLPLIKDEWSSLTTVACAAISRWVTMVAMVSDFADCATVIIPQSDRDVMYNLQHVPPGWLIWMGRADFGSRHPGYANRVGFHMGTVDVLSGKLTHHRFHHSTFTIGKLILMVSSITPPHPIHFIDPVETASTSHLVLIHPIDTAKPEKPSIVHSEDDVLLLGNSLLTAFDLPAIVFPPVSS